MKLHSADTQEKEVELSESPKRPEGSEDDSSDPDGDNQEATQEQPRPLRRSIRVTVSPTRYGWDDNHVSFTLVIENLTVTGKRSRQITTASGLHHWSKRWSVWIEIKYGH